MAKGSGRIMLSTFLALLPMIVFAAVSMPSQAQSGKKKALFVWGGSMHEPKQCVDIFAPWLKEQGFDVEVS